MSIYRWLRLALAGCTLGAGLALAAAPRAICLVQIPDPESPLKAVAVERIAAYYSGTVNVWHGSAAPAGAVPPALTVLLGEPGSDPRITQLWSQGREGDADAYRVKTVSPGVVAVSGRGPRGTLYAAYRLAELLETHADLGALDLHREPTVARRYALLGASSFGGAYERNLLYLKEIKELPRYGFNGVSILGYDDGNTPAGRTGPPFLVKGSSIIPIPSQIAEWRLLLHEIKRYGLDVALILPPLFPGQYQANEVVRHYSGESPIPHYNEQLASFFAEYLRACSRTLPEVDAIFLLNWEYPGNLGAQMFTFNTRIDRYRYGPRDPRTSAAVLETYAQTLETFGREQHKAVGYIAHLAGVHQADLRAMHEVLFRHPQLIKIEPPFFPDTGWPNLSLLGDWPADMDREQIFRSGAWGLLMTTTTGQYYGGGSLPTAFPDPYVKAAQLASGRHAELVMMLLDMWDATALGNLYNIDEILPLAACAQLWSPAPTLAATWDAWLIRRFGPVAGTLLKPALQSSGTIIRDGLTLEGVDLMVHGAIRAEAWRRPGLRTALFGNPGSPVVAPSSDGYPNSSDSMAAQMHARAIPIAEFRARERRALNAAVAGSQAVEAARQQLSAEDYAYLQAVFRDSQTVLRAMALIGEAAHAANVAASPADGAAAAATRFHAALTELRAYAAQPAVRAYRASAPERQERSTSGLVINPPLDQTLESIATGLETSVTSHPTSSP